MYIYKGLKHQETIKYICSIIETHGKLRLLSPKKRCDLMCLIDDSNALFPNDNKFIIKSIQEMFDDPKTSCHYYINKCADFLIFRAQRVLDKENKNGKVSQKNEETSV